MCFCFFLATLIASNRVIKEQRNHLSAHYALSLLNVPPVAMRLIAGEFNGIMADFILMQVSSFTGCGKKISPHEWEKVILGFDQVMALDPYFEQTYLQAQSEIAWGAQQPLEAIRLLDLSRKSRFWDYRPGFYMGFDYYYFLGDYDSASKIFMETSQVAHCPVLIPLLGSRFAIKENRSQASILVLENMLNQPDLDESSIREIENRISALKGVLILEDAVKKYRDRFGSPPESLDRLLEAGILNQLPSNPYSMPYTYDPLSHEIRFDDVKRMGK